MFIQPDVLIEIRYALGDPNWERSFIRTNAKREALEEILGDWLMDQRFRDQDLTGPPADRESFLVRIGLKLSDGGDEWGLESDAGNRALTIGIVAYTHANLDKVRVEGLS